MTPRDDVHAADATNPLHPAGEDLSSSSSFSPSSSPSFSPSFSSSSLFVSTAADHPLRQVLAHEVHARPCELLSSPSRASHLAMLSGEGTGAAEHRQLVDLCQRFGVTPPPAGVNHFSADLGIFRVKWERHTEFYTYTFFRPGRCGGLFEDPVIGLLPPDWLQGLTGQRLAAVHVALEPASESLRDPVAIEQFFDSRSVSGSELAGKSAVVWTDFTIHDDGFGRMLLLDVHLRARQAGRLVQRLLEIETYRMMSLLALPLARQYSPEISRLDQSLATVTARMTELVGLEDEQALLDEISRVAARVEHIAAATNFRFSAARAYDDLVSRRIAELREDRIEGMQTLEEFMERRLAPAMRTCESVQARQEALAARVARASNLLRTRVDIALEGQNRDLLQSMDQRSRIQLRLQETVEGLSIFVMTYYMVGLTGYMVKAAKAAGLHINADLVTGLAVPVIMTLVFFGMRRFHKAIAALRADEDDDG